MKRPILATLSLAAILVVALASPAAASSHTHQPYTGALSANSCAPGGKLHYQSDDTGQPSGSHGTYTLTGPRSGALGASSISLTADVTHAIRVGAHDQLAFTVAVPKSAQPGSSYTLTVKAGKFADSQTIQIIGVPASASATNLNALWIAIAVAILVALALSIYFVRRKKTDAV
jgi:hypothetical protein